VFLTPGSSYQSNAYMNVMMFFCSLGEESTK
jgi:hypothetical protein